MNMHLKPLPLPPKFKLCVCDDETRFSLLTPHLGPWQLEKSCAEGGKGGEGGGGKG